MPKPPIALTSGHIISTQTLNRARTITIRSRHLLRTQQITQLDAVRTRLLPIFDWKSRRQQLFAHSGANYTHRRFCKRILPLVNARIPQDRVSHAPLEHQAHNREQMRLCG